LNWKVYIPTFGYSSKLKIELILGVNAFKNRRIQFNFTQERIYLLE